MTKVMLVIDDFSELEKLETLLRRTGFDVLSLNKESSLPDALLGFMPELVISTFKGRLIDGARVLSKVKKPGGQGPRVAFLTAAGAGATVAADSKLRVDGVLESPIDPTRTLEIVARLLRHDPIALLDKYDRLRRGQPFDENDGSKVVKRGPGGEIENRELIHIRDSMFEPTSAPSSSDAEAARLNRYARFLTLVDEPVEGVLSHAHMHRAAQQLKDASRDEEERLKEIEREKREFVKALMKAGHRGG